MDKAHSAPQKVKNFKNHDKFYIMIIITQNKLTPIEVMN